jgi:asparagine synthase (glutamine-hydrolysing)
MFTGRHGNFTVSWDGWSQAVNSFRHGRLIRAFKAWLMFYRNTSLSRWESFRNLLFVPLFPTKVFHWGNRWLRINRISPWQQDSPIRPDFAIAMGVDQRAIAVGHDFFYRLPDRKLAATRLADFDGDWNQALKALTGVEVRDPTADVDVVSYCLAVPPEQFLAEGIDRSLIRRAMWGILPKFVLTNRLRGVQSSDWHEKLSESRTTLAEELNALSASPLAKRIIDFDRLNQALNNWPTKDWHQPQTVQEYRFVLSRGISSARFLAWMESLDIH